MVLHVHLDCGGETFFYERLLRENMSEFVDLSHYFEDGMPGFKLKNEDGTFTQLTARIRPFLTHEPKVDLEKLEQVYLSDLMLRGDDENWIMLIT